MCMERMLWICSTNLVKTLEQKWKWGLTKSIDQSQKKSKAVMKEKLAKLHYWNLPTLWACRILSLFYILKYTSKFGQMLDWWGKRVSLTTISGHFVRGPRTLRDRPLPAKTKESWLIGTYLVLLTYLHTFCSIRHFQTFLMILSYFRKITL